MSFDSNLSGNMRTILLSLLILIASTMVFMCYAYVSRLGIEFLIDSGTVARFVQRFKEGGSAEPMSLIDLLMIMMGAASFGMAMPSVTGKIGREQTRGFGVLHSLLFLCGCLSITCAIPAFLIYIFLPTHSHLRAIKIGVFLLSVGVAIVYFLYNKHKITSIPGRVGYFVGVCLGPANAVDILD